MPKTFAIIGLAAGLLTGTTLMAAAQLTTVDPGRDVSPVDNHLGPSSTSITDSPNGALGTRDNTVGNRTGTRPAVNRNPNGYTSAPSYTPGSPSAATGSGPPPAGSR
ncbi:MAG: hypothetical protein JO358_10525 [Alphaproteobacteria bacterium]|nr:hypothetical protein [Alphaproteobacteria bacterium]